MNPKSLVGVWRHPGYWLCSLTQLMNVGKTLLIPLELGRVYSSCPLNICEQALSL